MMVEELLYFQHRDGEHDWLVNATEFRTLKGNRYSLTIINRDGYNAYVPPSREAALDQAQRAVCSMIASLCEHYAVKPR